MQTAAFTQTRAMIVILVLLPGSLLSRQKTDIIVLANGDRITGEIKGLDSGVLHVDLDYVDGTISVQWSKVARVESKHLFIVQTQDGSLYTGTLATEANQLRKIQIAGGAETKVAVDQDRIVKIHETSETFLRRLSGSINMGVVYSKGNNATQYNLGSEIEYRRERWGGHATLSSNLSASSGSNTATRNQTDFTGYHLLRAKKYYYGGLLSVLQSSAQGISNQTTLGGGIGRYFKNTNRLVVSALGGLAWQGTSYQESTSDGAAHNVAAGLLTTDVRFFMFKKTNLTWTTVLVPAFSSGGRVHVNTNASYYLKLFRNLSWNLSLYGSWDTQPPPNFSKADYGYSSGLGWTFGFR